MLDPMLIYLQHALTQSMQRQITVDHQLQKWSLQSNLSSERLPPRLTIQNSLADLKIQKALSQHAFNIHRHQMLIRLYNQKLSLLKMALKGDPL